MNSTNTTVNDIHCDNIITGEYAISIMYTTYHRVMFLGVIPVIIVLGVTLNLAMLFVVFRIPRMRNVTNFYLCNLAVSDSVMLITAGVQYLSSYYYSPIDWDLSFATPLGCLIFEMSIRLFYYASAFFVCLVTFDRYLAICHPMKHRLIKGKRFTGTTTTCMWSIATLMAALAFSHRKIENICIIWPNETQYSTLKYMVPVCTHSFSSPKVGFGFILTWQLIELCQFMLAIFLCTYMFVRIIYSLSTRPNPNKASLFVRNQIARMLMVNGIVFFLCHSLAIPIDND